MLAGRRRGAAATGMDTGRFDGKVFLITGASAGIGRAVAFGAAAEGARLVLAARTEGPLEETAAALRDAGTEALGVPTDVGNDRECASLVRRAMDAFGRIDVLVNNAGVHHRGPFQSLAPAEATTMIDLNLRAPILLTRMCLDDMLRRDQGRIVNVASLAGCVPLPESVGYSASKFGLRAFSLALAEELRGTGIRVSVVSPGPVSTSFILGDVDKTSDLTFSQPMSSPGQVADAIIDCAADGRPERKLPRSSGALATAAYLFPPLARWLRPALRRKGARTRERLRKTLSRG